MKNSKIFTVLFYTIILSFFLMSFNSRVISQSYKFKTISELIMQDIIDDATIDFDTVGDEGEGCPDTDAELKAIDRKLTFINNKTPLYDLRDNFLKKNARGLRYVDEYYYIGSVKKDYTKFDNATLLQVFSILPKVEQAYSNIKSATYTGVIIDKTFSDEIKKVISSYKLLSSDARYNTIIDKLILDVNFVTGKNKSQVLDFMKS
jgi:hypothetical protein